MAKSMLCVIAALSSLQASGGDFAAGDNITADRKLAADNNFTDGRQFTTDAGDDNPTSSAGVVGIAPSCDAHPVCRSLVNPSYPFAGHKPQDPIQFRAREAL